MWKEKWDKKNKRRRIREDKQEQESWRRRMRGCEKKSEIRRILEEKC